MNNLRTIDSIKRLKLKKDIKINRTHVILDIYKADEDILSKAADIEKEFKKILKAKKLEPQIESFYQFEPFGVTAIVCAYGVHFTLHTWPELKSAAVDLYSLREKDFTLQLVEEIKNVFKSTEYEMKVRSR